MKQVKLFSENFNERLYLAGPKATTDERSDEDEWGSDQRRPDIRDVIQGWNEDSTWHGPHFDGVKGLQLFHYH